MDNTSIEVMALAVIVEKVKLKPLSKLYYFNELYTGQ